MSKGVRNNLARWLKGVRKKEEGGEEGWGGGKVKKRKKEKKGNRQRRPAGWEKRAGKEKLSLSLSASNSFVLRARAPPLHRPSFSFPLVPLFSVGSTTEHCFTRLLPATLFPPRPPPPPPFTRWPLLAALRRRIKISTTSFQPILFVVYVYIYIWNEWEEEWRSLWNIV